MKKITVGDVVSIDTLGDERHEKHRVVRVHPDGVETVREEPYVIACQVMFRRWKNIVQQDDVAVPGEIYKRRHSSHPPELYVGRPNNRIRLIKPDYVPVEIDFHASEFERVRSPGSDSD